MPTERERYVLDQGLPVYRVLYRRNTKPLPPLAEFEAECEQICERVDNPAETTQVE